MIPEHARKIMHELADDEACTGFRYAEEKLRTKVPSVAYEYGVKAGFIFGLDAGYTLRDQEAAKEMDALKEIERTASVIPGTLDGARALLISIQLSVSAALQQNPPAVSGGGEEK